MDSQQPRIRRDRAHGSSCWASFAVITFWSAQSAIFGDGWFCLPACGMALEFHTPNNQTHLDKFHGALVRRLVLPAADVVLLVDRCERLSSLVVFLCGHRYERHRRVH